MCLGQVSSLEMAPGKGWAEATQGQARQREGEACWGCRPVYTGVSWQELALWVVWGECAHLGGCQLLRASLVPSFQPFCPSSHPADPVALGPTEPELPFLLVWAGGLQRPAQGMSPPGSLPSSAWATPLCLGPSGALNFLPLCWHGLTAAKSRGSLPTSPPPGLHLSVPAHPALPCLLLNCSRQLLTAQGHRPDPQDFRSCPIYVCGLLSYDSAPSS